MTAALPVLKAGQVLAPGYEVLDHLARGQALDVYDVWSDERDCHCVAKTPRPDRLTDVAVRRRLLREGRILLDLAHPNIVRAYELVRGASPALVLETLTGGSVHDALSTASRRPALGAVVQLGIHLCSALHYLHGRELLHGDLKPANVMMDRGFAKVIDLSLVCRPGKAVRGRGTRGYMAPEQARGGHVSAATDVWGVGATLYAATVGRKPFGPGPDAGAYAQLERRADRVEAHRRLPRTHAPLGELIAACLEPEPRARPALGEVTDRLDELLED